MMRATDFEFRHRPWIFAVMYSASFWLYALDHVPVGQWIWEWLSRTAPLPERTSAHVVLGAAGLAMVAAALLRTWGSAYLGHEVVHDKAVHSETLHADGPYRHVRNPLYLGNLLMLPAMAVIAPLAGLPIMLIGVPVFCLRLIGREEAALEAEQGERYRAYMREVPRLWPSLRARIPASGGRPDWASGLAGEAFFWSFAGGVIGLAIFLKPVWFFAGLVLSPLFSVVAVWAVRKRHPKR